MYIYDDKTLKYCPFRHLHKHLFGSQIQPRTIQIFYNVGRNTEQLIEKFGGNAGIINKVIRVQN